MPKHELMEQISKRISDGAMLHIIRQFLDAGIMEENEIHNTDRGTPQGSPLSPLLANIYLDQLDKQWKASGLKNRNREDAHLIRYADDFVILVKGSAETAKIKLDEIMETIDLTLNKEKTRIVKAEEGFDFLGFRFVRKYSKRRGKRTTRWYPSPRSEQKIKEKIRELTDKSKLSIMTPEQAKEQLIPLLRGWGNYFAHSTVSTKLYEIWDYAQRRLMYLYCRQHNKPRTWKYRDIKKRHLYIVDTLPRTIASNRHKAM
ncbi:MAG: reverse transcriptase domain-containing protein [Thermoplasmata archaeon]